MRNYIALKEGVKDYFFIGGINGSSVDSLDKDKKYITVRWSRVPKI